MDSTSSSCKIDRAALQRAHRGNILIFSDGGLRPKKKVASSAWIAYLIEGTSATKLAWQRLLLEGVSSSFQAEVIGLDLALIFLQAISSGSQVRMEDWIQHNITVI